MWWYGDLEPGMACMPDKRSGALRPLRQHALLFGRQNTTDANRTLVPIAGNLRLIQIARHRTEIENDIFNYSRSLFSRAVSTTTHSARSITTTVAMRRHQPCRKPTTPRLVCTQAFHAACCRIRRHCPLVRESIHHCAKHLSPSPRPMAVYTGEQVREREMNRASIVRMRSSPAQCRRQASFRRKRRTARGPATAKNIGSST